MAGEDRRALRLLYDAYHPMLLSFARRMLGQQQEAEEVVQDVFIRAWHLADRYDPERSQPLGWLFMMTRSIALDRLRKRVKAAEMSLSGEQNASFEQLSSEEAMQSFEKVYNEEWVDRLLGGLPDSQRRCLEMTVLEGYTQAEVANRLNRPLGTVKSEIRRGLARLRALWKKEDTHAS